MRKQFLKTLLRYRKFAFFLLIALFLLCLKPAKEYLRKYRFNRSLEAATEQIQQENAQEAESRLKLAWQVSDQSLEELRELLQSAYKLRSPLIVSILKGLYEKENLTEKDYAKALETCLDFGQPHLFSDFYKKLPSQLKEKASFHFYQSRFLAATGREEEALEIARRNLEQIPAARHLTRQLLLKKGNDVKALEKALVLVREDLASEDPEVGLLALRDVQLFDTLGDRLLGSELVDWLESKQVGLPKDYFFAYTLMLRQAPEAEREAVILQVHEKFETEQPAELARWLLENKAHSSLEKLNPSEGSGNEIAYLARVQSLIDSESYEKAWLVLEKPHLKIENHLIEALKSGLAFKRDDPTSSLFHRNRALQAAALSDRYESFAAILKIAERFEDQASAEKIVAAIIELNPKILPNATKLDFLDRYLKFDAAAICDFYERLHASKPTDPFVRRKYALMLILAERDVSRARRLLNPLFRATPSDSLSCTIALTWLKESPEKALEGLEGIDPQNLQDPARLIYATILSTNGMTAEAQGHLQMIDETRVKPYLLSFLKGVLKK